MSFRRSNEIHFPDFNGFKYMGIDLVGTAPIVRVPIANIEPDPLPEHVPPLHFHFFQTVGKTSPGNLLMIGNNFADNADD
jgi:hypothetical protein